MTTARKPPALPEQNLLARRRLVSLLDFLIAIASRRETVEVYDGNAERGRDLGEVPMGHPCVVRGDGTATVQVRRSTMDGMVEEDLPLILQIRRPEPERPPEVPSILDGWVAPRGSAEELAAPPRFFDIRPESQLLGLIDGAPLFEDDAIRVQARTAWSAEWAAWSARVALERPVQDAFRRLFEFRRGARQQDARQEAFVSIARIIWHIDGQPVSLPLLNVPAEMTFDPDGPTVTIVESGRPFEADPITLDALAREAGHGSEMLQRWQAEIQQGVLDDGPAAVEGFLNRLVHELHPDGRCLSAGQSPAVDETDIPYVIREQRLYYRDRPDGFVAFAERLREQVQDGADIPVALQRLLGVDGRTLPPLPELASPWGVPSDVLLTKPANREQVAIVQQLDRAGAVLVQGPPGTGKSHTIANLLGHLLAQGKKVLVTSHGTRALEVLRDKVERSLQPLCVSVLDAETQGRTAVEVSVRGIVERLSNDDADRLRREADALEARRTALLAELESATAVLHEARVLEHAPIALADRRFTPAEAARWLREQASEADWIPGTVAGTAALPLGTFLLRQLYEDAVALSAADEQELRKPVPSLDQVPTPEAFEALCRAATAKLESWPDAFGSDAGGASSLILREAMRGVDRLHQDELALASWERAIVAAGVRSSADADRWRQLASAVRQTVQQREQVQAMLDAQTPKIDGTEPVTSIRPLLEEMVRAARRTGRLRWHHLLLHRAWKPVLLRCQVLGGTPRTAEELEAVLAAAHLRQTREELHRRWRLVAVPAGVDDLPGVTTEPEQLLRLMAERADDLLGWWRERMRMLGFELDRAGLRHGEVRTRMLARDPMREPFEVECTMMRTEVPALLRTALAHAEQREAMAQLQQLEQSLRTSGVATAIRLAEAIAGHAVVGYREAWLRLEALLALRPVEERRRQALTVLASCAAEWASALHRREGVHGSGRLPADPLIAWQIRQVTQALDLIGVLEEQTQVDTVHRLQDALQRCTTELVASRAWAHQLSGTTAKQRSSLVAWAQLMKKIGKGTGKLAPERRRQAAQMLDEAAAAIPVWIMPFARVVDTLGAERRFDVVIIDEASQSDIRTLAAWCLGTELVVVGDDEQVTPLAVGTDMGYVAKLARQHLQELPNAAQYEDGTKSVYEFAEQACGGTVRLREHFRCVPPIIEYSSSLCYDGSIRPLRDASRVPGPHLAEVRATAKAGDLRVGGTKQNEAEARWVAALAAAMHEHPDYAGKSIGAISLLGDEQAKRIQTLAYEVLGATGIETRRFSSGDAAQFQGDERDVMLLSMVDTPLEGTATLRTQPLFRQRYNVAASRARDQLWLVHSIQSDGMLKPGDLRAGLLKHVRSGAQASAATSSTDSIGMLARAVHAMLLSDGFETEVAVPIGGWRVPLIVRGAGVRVVVECDEEQTVGMIPVSPMRTLEQQAVLERAGWHYVRMAASRWHRNPAAARSRLLELLARHGVYARPAGAEVMRDGAAARQHAVTRRAMEIMIAQRWATKALLFD